MGYLARIRTSISSWGFISGIRVYRSSRISVAAWKLMAMRSTALILLLLCSVGAFCEPLIIRMIAHSGWGIPPKDAADPASVTRRAIFDEFQRRNPDLRVVNAAGLQVAGNQPDAPLLMGMAGDTAPDVFYVNFRQMTNYIEQGFCRPLDDL